MGRRGPARTPTKILAGRGSWLAKTRTQEPQPEAVAPEMPGEFGAAEREAWLSVTSKLSGMGLLYLCDEAALRRYCRLLVRWTAASDWLREHGEVYPVLNEEGKPVAFRAFPQVGIVSDLGTALLRIEQEFGLTPSARSRVHVSENRGVTDAKAKGGRSFFN